MGKAGIGQGANMTMKRMRYEAGTGTTTMNPRAPINGQTHFLDASVIYGADSARAQLLRTFNGGLMIADPVNGLPKNTKNIPMAGTFENSAEQRAAGDPRANISPGLLALQGVFVLEHNRQAGSLSKANPMWDDERLFQEARKRVMALIQSVTYNEYVPILLGEGLPKYAGYNPSVDASVDVAFAAAAYRYGHSGINAVFWCAEDDGSTCPSGNLLLRDVYFKPYYLEYTTIAHYLRGGILQPESAIDTVMVDDIRNHLEGIRNDLAAIDILRGREAGIPSFARARQLYGLQPPTTFQDITSNTRIATVLAQLYGNDVNKVDLWVGGLAEQVTTRGAFVGETFRAIIKDQFIRTRDGDRFWFENDQLGHFEAGAFVPYLTAAERDEIKGTTMADIIKRTTGAKGIPNSVFRVPASLPTAATGGTGGTDAAEGNGTAVSTQRTAALGPAISLEWEAPSAGATELEITAKFKGTGWFAVGLGSGMRDADVIMMRVQGGNPEVIDATSSGYMLPAPDRQQNVELVSGSEAGGVTTVVFKRRISTGDASDKVITSGPNSVIVAWDPSSDAYGPHGANRLAGLSVDFLKAAGTDSGGGFAGGFGSLDIEAQIREAKLAAYGFHGLSMFSTWGVLVPAGVFTVRFAKHLTIWQAFHRWSMMLAATLTIPAAGAALAATANGNAIAHQYIGVTVAGTLIIEIVAGSVVRQFLRGTKVPPKSFFYTKLFHRVFGWVLTAAGMTNCYLGVAELLPEIKYYILAYFVVIIFAFVGLGLYDDVTRDRLSSPAKLKSTTDSKLDRTFIAESHQSLTMLDVKKNIRAGNKWVLLDGWVFNVTSFISNHPGGAYLVERSVGTDVGQFFFGRDQFSPMVGKHVHSQRAHDLLRGMCVGVLKSSGTSDSSGNWADRTSGDRIQDSQLWTVVRRKVVNPGAKREVVKLELRCDDCAGLSALDWRLSTFGRYMLIRFPIEDGGAETRASSASSVHFKRRSSVVELLGQQPSNGTLFVERPYTIVRRDGLDGFDMYVRKYPRGQVSPLVHQLAVGDDVMMLGPKGVGIHLDDDSEGVVVAIAQGTGVFTYFDTISYLMACTRERVHNGLPPKVNAWVRPEWDGEVRTTGKQIPDSGSAWTSTPTAARGHSGGRIAPASGFAEHDLRSSGIKLEDAEPEIAPVVVVPPGAMRSPQPGDGPLRVVTGSPPSDSSVQDEDEDCKAAPMPRYSGAGGASSAGKPGLLEEEDELGELTSPKAAGQRYAGTMRSMSTADPSFGPGPDAYTPSTIDVGGITTKIAPMPGPNRGPIKPKGTAAAGASVAGSCAASESDAASTGSKRQRPKNLKLIMICCFENEDNILEGEWLNHCARECPNFELFINVKTANRGGRVLESYQHTSTGYLTDTKLASLLPPRDLLFVSICGTTGFSRLVHDRYVEMGLPRGLVSVV